MMNIIDALPVVAMPPIFSKVNEFRNIFRGGFQLFHFFLISLEVTISAKKIFWVHDNDHYLPLIDNLYCLHEKQRLYLY